MNPFALSLLAGITLAGTVCAQTPVSLFDGKTLKGWKAVTCEAEVVD